MERDQVPAAGWMDIARLQVLVQLRREDRNWKEAEAALDRVEKMTPNLVEVKLLRAEVLAAQERYDDAELYLVKELNGTPNEVELWVARAGLVERDKALTPERKHERARAVLAAAKQQLGDRIE